MKIKKFRKIAHVPKIPEDSNKDMTSLCQLLPR